MISRHLRTLSVFARVALLVGLGVVAVIAVSISALQTRSVMNRSEMRITQLEALHKGALELKVQVARGQGRFLEFVQVPMEHLAERLKAGITDTLGGIDSLISLSAAGDVPVELTNLQGIMREALAQALVVQQGQGVLGSTSNDGLRGEVQEAMTALESAIRSEVDGSASIVLHRMAATVQSLMRRKELLQGSRDSAVEAELSLDTGRLERLIGQLHQASPDAAMKLHGLLNTFLQRLDKWLVAARQLDADMLKIENGFTLAQPPLDALVLETTRRVEAVRTEAADSMASEERNAAIIAGLMLTICLALAMLVVRSISHPLTDLQLAMQAIAKGDTGFSLQGMEATDEIGAMTRAVAVFRDEMVARQRMSEATVLQAEQRSERAADVDRSVAEFDRAMREALAALGASGGNLGFASQQLDKSSQMVAERTRIAHEATESMAGRISTVASATDELSSSIAAISAGTDRAAGAADGALQQVDQTEQRMRDLLDITGQIGDVITLIRQIASQTNLLALNATIEAARAGESGRGFAIVASEVKTLAAQTQSATEEISRKIEAIQSGASNMSTSIQDMSKVVLDMREIAIDVAAAIRQQDATVVEIASTMSMLADDASLNLRSVRDTAEAARAAESIAREVGETAGSMRDVADRLSSDVGTFISRVRAA